MVGRVLKAWRGKAGKGMMMKAGNICGRSSCPSRSSCARRPLLKLQLASHTPCRSAWHRMSSAVRFAACQCAPLSLFLFVCLQLTIKSDFPNHCAWTTAASSCPGPHRRASDAVSDMARMEGGGTRAGGALKDRKEDKKNKGKGRRSAE